MSVLSEPPRRKVEASLVRKLVDAQFPNWASLPIEQIIPGGWDNWTFKLGADMTVRLPSAERYASQVDKEQEWLPRLAPSLPLRIPEPFAVGQPACGFPWPWSVYRWIEGSPLSSKRSPDLVGIAEGLARFLTALYAIDAKAGPPAGVHNFHRGGHPCVYDSETHEALSKTSDIIDSRSATDLWESATATRLDAPAVWVHGDINPGNLLVDKSKLSAVIDFGSSAVGDPACDLGAAWTLFSGPSRAAFMNALTFDSDTWLRARAWALWKAAKTLATNESNNQSAISLIEGSARRIEFARRQSFRQPQRAPCPSRR